MQPGTLITRLLGKHKNYNKNQLDTKKATWHNYGNTVMAITANDMQSGTLITRLLGKHKNYNKNQLDTKKATWHNYGNTVMAIIVNEMQPGTKKGYV